MSSIAKELKPPAVPQAVLLACRRRGIEAEPLEAYACADMSPEGELRHIHLLLKAERLILAVSALSGDMEFSSGFGKAPAGREEEIREVYAYSLETLSDPQIHNQVVGGLLAVQLNGTETWLCRFSGSSSPA